MGRRVLTHSLRGYRITHLQSRQTRHGWAAPGPGRLGEGRIPPLDGEGRREAAGWGDLQLDFANLSPTRRAARSALPARGRDGEPHVRYSFLHPIPLKPAMTALAGYVGRHEAAGVSGRTRRRHSRSARRPRSPYRLQRPIDLHAARLGFEQPSIDAAGTAQQLGVGAVLDDAPILEHEDAIEPLHRRQAMRHH
jgi:hypothetical protein